MSLVEAGLLSTKIYPNKTGSSAILYFSFFLVYNFLGLCNYQYFSNLVVIQVNGCYGVCDAVSHAIYIISVYICVYCYTVHCLSEEFHLLHINSFAYLLNHKSAALCRSPNG